MAMREKYTKPSAKINYFCAEWDESKLSWADFRGKVLGATDPTTAVAGSLRKTILDTYQDLGLNSAPNVGDNGVHASASPFEALAERLNWIGAKPTEDAFGQALIKAGVKEDMLKTWTKDPQVEYEGKKGSLFDTLEDTNASVCLTKCQKIAGGSGAITFSKNMAFVFVKPHAVTPKVVDVVKKKFAEVGISIVKEGILDGKTIEEKLLIDNHYYAIANKASLSKPKDLNVPPPKQDEFKQKFGIAWKEALQKDLVFNAVDACAKLGIDGETMDGLWAKTKKADLLVKFGGGFYCGKVTKA